MSGTGNCESSGGHEWTEEGVCYQCGLKQDSGASTSTEPLKPDEKKAETAPAKEPAKEPAKAEPTQKSAKEIAKEKKDKEKADKEKAKKEKAEKEKAEKERKAKEKKEKEEKQKQEKLEKQKSKGKGSMQTTPQKSPEKKTNSKEAVIVLVSNITSTDEQERQQRELQQILTGRGIDYTLVDGDKKDDDFGSKLRVVSGKNTYPQVFRLNKTKKYSFCGDYKDIQKANDQGETSLRALLNIQTQEIASPSKVQEVKDKKEECEIILLTSKITSTDEQEREQRELQQLLEGRKIDFKLVDGSNTSDPLPEKLRGISKQTTYPQVFHYDSKTQAYDYRADFSRVKSANDESESRLRELLGIPPRLVAQKTEMKKSSPKDGVFILISTITTTEAQEREQRELEQIIKGRNIGYTIIDAGVKKDEPFAKKLREISKKDTYPQVFHQNQTTLKYDFCAEFKQVVTANDDSEACLRKLLRLDEPLGGNQFVILVINSKSAIDEEIKNMPLVPQLLKQKNVGFQVLDVADPLQEKKAKKFIAESRKTYFPQVFASDFEGDYLFIGGYQEIQDAVDDNSLLQLLGLRKFVNHKGDPNIDVPDDVDTMIDAEKRLHDKKRRESVARTFVTLESFKGSKIWNLSERERSLLWESIDSDKNDYLSVTEMQDFAAAFWEEQMARGDDRREQFGEGTVLAEHQIKLLREALQQHIDIGHDGRIDKSDFIKQWNKVAKTAFKPSLCTIL